MSLGILGNKVGMTQVFDTKGNVIPVTVLKTGPCYVTQIKSNSTCGYNAIQLGYVEISTKPKLRKPKVEKVPVEKKVKETTGELSLLLNEEKTDDLIVPIEQISKIGETLAVTILKPKKTLTKPRLGHFNKVNLPPYRYLKEYKTDDLSYEIGHKFDVEIFEVGQKISVTG